MKAANENTREQEHRVMADASRNARSVWNTVSLTHTTQKKTQTYVYDMKVSRHIHGK